MKRFLFILLVIILGLLSVLFAMGEWPRTETAENPFDTPQSVDPYIYEKMLRTQWTQTALPDEEMTGFIQNSSAVTWFNLEIVNAWIANQTFRQRWEKDQQGRMLKKYKKMLDDYYVFQVYLKVNATKLTIPDKANLDLKFTLVNDKGVLVEPVEVKEGPADYYAFNGFPVYQVLFPKENEKDGKLLIDPSTKKLKLTATFYNTPCWFEWTLQPTQN